MKRLLSLVLSAQLFCLVGCVSRVQTGTLFGPTGQLLTSVPMEVRRPITKRDAFPGPWGRGGMRIESETQTDTNGCFSFKASRKATELWIYDGGRSDRPVRIPLPLDDKYQEIRLPNKAAGG